jgi:hypothetical protein
MNSLTRAADLLNRAAPPGERLAFVNPMEERGLKAAGGMGRPAAGGVPSYKKGDVEAPPPRDYAGETRDTLQAQIDLMPDLIAAKRKFMPQMAETQVEMAEMFSPRLLDLYENKINPVLSRIDAAAVRRQREADISAVRELGPEATQALMDSDPERAKLLRGLTDQAQSELALGGQLSAAEQRAISQDVLAQRSATGMSYGPDTAAYVALAQQQGRQQRLRDRQRFAGQVAGMRTSMLGDPFQQITGRSGRVGAGSGAGIFGQTQGLSGQLFNPESNYAGGIYGANAQAQLAARTATANNRAALGAGMMNMFGAIGGGYASTLG